MGFNVLESHISCASDDDNISKLLDRHAANNSGVSLRDEFIEIGEPVKDYPSDGSGVIRSTSPCKITREERKRFSLQDCMREFDVLSRIMDAQIRLVVSSEARDEKGGRKKGNNGLVNERWSENEKRNLQMEFNKMLDSKENEIENAEVENLALKAKLIEKKDFMREIERENDELSDCLQIKKDQVDQLELQLKLLRQQCYHVTCKLNQSEDLLEMTEEDRDKDIQKYKGTITKLKRKLESKRSSNSKHTNSDRNQGSQSGKNRVAYNHTEDGLLSVAKDKRHFYEAKSTPKATRMDKLLKFSRRSYGISNNLTGSHSHGRMQSCLGWVDKVITIDVN